MDNSCGLENPNQLENPTKMNNSLKDCYGQRSKRVQKDYSVNFSRITVQETDRLTRSRTRSDPNFSMKDFFTIKEGLTTEQRRQRVKSNIQAKVDEVSKMDEFSEKNKRATDAVEPNVENRDNDLANMNLKEINLGNLPGKRDVLLASMINCLEYPSNNNSHSEGIAAETNVAEFDPTTDLDQMLENSIDPDKYLSSLEHEEIILTPEIIISDKKNGENKDDKSNLVDYASSLSLGTALHEDFPHQNSNDGQLFGQQLPVYLSSMKHFLDIVKNKNQLLICGSNLEDILEEKLKAAEDLFRKSSQNFEKSITPQVPTIILKTEEAETFQITTDHCCQSQINAQTASQLTKPSQNPQQSLENQINLSCFQDKLEQVLENDQNGENKNDSNGELKTTMNQGAIENLENHWKTPKLKLGTTSVQEENESKSISDSKLLNSHVSQYPLLKGGSLGQETLEVQDSIKSEETPWNHSNMSSSSDLSRSEENLEFTKNSNGDWKAANSACQKETQFQESTFLSWKTHLHMDKCTSTITSATSKQRTLGATKDTLSLEGIYPLQIVTENSKLYKNSSQLETENTSGIDKFLNETCSHRFGQEKIPVWPSDSSFKPEKLDSSSEMQQKSVMFYHNTDALSLWDTPAEEFLIEDINFAKTFSVSGGSIERVFSPTLKKRETTSNYPGISIPSSENDVFLSISSHSMQLEDLEEPKYQIELVDTPPPLRNYRSPRVPEIMPNPKLFERPIYRNQAIETKRKTIYKPKRGRRTRAEMEMYREEMARRKQNEKKTDMERYIPNYFHKACTEINQLRTETPFVQSRTNSNNQRNLHRAVNSEHLLRTETPSIPSQMEQLNSYPSCSKLGQLKHKVSGSANIINNVWNAPSYNIQKPFPLSVMVETDFLPTVKNFPVVQSNHQLLEQDLPKIGGAQPNHETKHFYPAFNPTQKNISETLSQPVPNVSQSLHQATDIHNYSFQTVQPLQPSHLYQSTHFQKKVSEANRAQQLCPQLTQQDFSSHKSYPANQLSQNFERNNLNLPEMAEQHNQFPLFQQYSPQNTQPPQLLPFSQPYFPYQRF